MMSQVQCPYCGSVQVKAMANQPKKYPRPVDPVELLDWQRGYDCKRCGNDFVVTPPKPKKPLGFFGKLIKYSAIFIIALIAFSIFFGALNESGDTEKQETPKEKSAQSSEPKQDESILSQVFSEDAEKAAHENIPTEEDYKKYESIQNSTDQNDTLSIKTTIRESE